MSSTAWIYHFSMLIKTGFHHRITILLGSMLHTHFYLSPSYMISPVYSTFPYIHYIANAEASTIIFLYLLFSFVRLQLPYHSP